jgi:hypothetical protein
MTASAGRRRRRGRGEGSRRIATDRRIGGLVRWQGARRTGGARLGVWILVSLAALLLTLALIAPGTGGGLHWGNLLMLVPGGVLAVAFGAGLIALIRRAVAWLAG